MIKTKKGFTIVELIVTISIIVIISTISYITINSIFESNIKNKGLDILSFINNLKNEVIKDNKKEVYIFLSSTGNLNKNKYIFSYVKDNNCNNLELNDIYDNYILDDHYVFFTGALIDNTSGINLFKFKDLKNFSNIFGDDIINQDILEHDISDSQEFKYTLYGTGYIFDDNQERIEKIVNCGDIYVFFLDLKKYNISNLIIEDLQKQYSFNQIILKFNQKNIKGELYIDNINSQRSFFKNIYIQIKDNINNLFFDFNVF